MKVCIIGSSQYRDKILEHKQILEAEGHTVLIPAFDSHPDLDDFGVCRHNCRIIESAERVDVIWDNRSTGFIFDFGMVFALGKPIKIIYIESKTLEGVLRKYASRFISS
jgi:diphthamide synthase subunit DPH2